ncbi:acyl-CoA thioesterase [Oceanithermus sp.]
MKLEHFPIVVSVDVRYRDLDTFNHVNNAVYLTYFEQARVAYFKSLGWRSDDASVVVARAEVNYRRPILLGDEVRVGCRVARIGNRSYVMEYLIIAAGEVAADGQTVQVFLKRGRPAPLPDGLIERIRAVEEGPGR